MEDVCEIAVDKAKSWENANDEENSVYGRVVSAMIDFLIYSIIIFALIIYRLPGVTSWVAIDLLWP